MSGKDKSKLLEWYLVSERIKASVTILEFVGQYVDLKPTASGAIGLWLLHDDHHPSCREYPTHLCLLTHIQITTLRMMRVTPLT